MYIFNANESENADVWFDDFTVTHLGIDITQNTDYYPFGSLMSHFQKPPEPGEAAEDYRFGYQGEFAEEDQETGWNQFEARMYDPLIGRWLQVDPYRQFPSPYIGMGNNPILYVDPDGGCVDRDGNPVDCNGGADGLNGQHSIVLDNLEIQSSPIVPGSLEDMRFLASVSPLGRAFINDPALNTRGRLLRWNGYYSRNFSFLDVGTGIELDFFIGPGGGISLDRIADKQGGNDLYFTIKGGVGANVSAEVHGIVYDSSPTASDIVGWAYFYGGGYGPLSYERASSIELGGTDIILNRVNSNTVGLGIGTEYLIGGGQAGFSYTLNVSDISRYI